MPRAVLIALSFCSLGYAIVLVNGQMNYPHHHQLMLRSCTDHANSSRIAFRQKTYCVTAAEKRAWDRRWLRIYITAAFFVILCIALRIESGIRR